MTIFYVYLHLKPNGDPFYVGKGTFKRCHNFSRRNQYHKRIVAKYGVGNIEILVFQMESEQAAFESEVEWISNLTAAGFSLANMTYGGEGVSGCVPTPETRAKLAAAKFGKKFGPHSDEWNAKIAAGAIGRKLSAEAREKVSASKRGKPRPGEVRAKLSAANKGKPWSTARRLANQSSYQSVQERSYGLPGF